MSDSAGQNPWPFLIFAIFPAMIWLGLWRSSRIQRIWLRNVVRTVGWFFGVSSTLLLFLSLPTGSIDIADLWRFSLFVLTVAVPLILIRLSLNGLIRATWAQVTIGGASVLVLIPASLVLFLMCMAEIGCVKRSSPVYSPNGAHLVLQEVFLGGALGDQSHVYVRRKWVPFANQAFSGEAQPEIHWLDSSRLLIRYYDYRKPGNGSTVCRSRAAGVTVVCENTTKPIAK